MIKKRKKINKKNSQNRYISRMRRAAPCGPTSTRDGLGVVFADVIPHFEFGFDRLSGLGPAMGQNTVFPMVNDRRS
jgi:hypothetical protein